MQDFFRQRYVRLLGLCFLRIWTSEKKVYGAKLELLGLDTAGMIQPKSLKKYLDISGHPNVLLNSWCFSTLTFGFPKVHGRYMLE